MNETNAWYALTAVLALKKEAGLGDVQAHLRNTPSPHVVAAQLIIIGAGCGRDLIPDGDWGDESFYSLTKLYNTYGLHN